MASVQLQSMHLCQAGAAAVEETCHANRSLNPNLVTPRRTYVAVNYQIVTTLEPVQYKARRRICPHHDGLTHSHKGR